MKTAIKMSVVYREKLADILSEICQIFEEDIEKVRAKSRKMEYVKLRHLYFYVACNILNKKVPLRLIGDFVGGFDHTTVINGRELIKGYIQNQDPFFYDEWLEYQEKSAIWKSYLAA